MTLLTDLFFFFLKYYKNHSNEQHNIVAKEKFAQRELDDFNKKGIHLHFS